MKKSNAQNRRRFSSWLNPRSLTVRLLLTAGLWMVIGLGVGGFLLSNAFRNYAENDFDDRLIATMEALVGVSELDADGQITYARKLADQRFEEPYSGWYWQVSTLDEVMGRSRSLWDRQLSTDFSHSDVGVDIFQAFGPDGQLLRIAERDIAFPGIGQPLRYMVAGDISEIEEQTAGFNRLLVLSLGGLGLGLLAAILAQITFGLLPLGKIRVALSDIRSGKATRLQRDFPPEILPLVDEVNAVLDHNDDLVSRARTHVGNLAHALKTPLSVLANESQKQKPTEFSKRVSNQVGYMRRHVDHHLTRARTIGRHRELGARAPVLEIAEQLERALSRIYNDKAIKFKLAIEEGLAFRGDREDLVEMLGNVMDNACKWAHGTVIVTGATEEVDGRARAILRVEDDGPGVDDDKLSDIFTRGKRLDESKPGSGLGLAIVGDIAEICSGSIRLFRSPLGGLGVEISLPVAVSSDVA